VLNLLGYPQVKADQSDKQRNLNSSSQNTKKTSQRELNLSLMTREVRRVVR